jgi:hypothetical protein
MRSDSVVLLVAFFVGNLSAAFAETLCESAAPEFLAKSFDDRIGIQLDLILTGYFNSFVSEKFGKRLCNSVLSFEKKMTLQPTQDCKATSERFWQTKLIELASVGA